jgi:hypothetical protein
MLIPNGHVAIPQCIPKGKGATHPPAMSWPATVTTRAKRLSRAPYAILLACSRSFATSVLRSAYLTQHSTAQRALQHSSAQHSMARLNMGWWCCSTLGNNDAAVTASFSASSLQQQHWLQQTQLTRRPASACCLTRLPGQTAWAHLWDKDCIHG